MKLKILGWSYREIRGVHNLEIDLTRSDSTPYPVSLIMMPNGLGKTTTMTLLRATLDGSAATWKPDFVQSLRPPGSSAGSGQFTARFLIDGAKYIVMLDLDYLAGQARYKTSRVGSTGGLDDGLRLPSNVLSMFSPQFVKRFVFDGELAKQILSSGSREAEEAITYLYQLDRLGRLQATADRIVEREQESKDSKAKTNQGLSKLRTHRESWLNRLNSLYAEAQRLEEDLITKKRRLAEVETQIEQEMSKDAEIGQRLDFLKAQQKDVSDQIREVAGETLDAMRDPYSLFPTNAARLQELVSGMEKLKLPQTVSSQFFEELAQHDTCICGHPIGEVESQHIREHASNYLAEDQIGAMNIIKSALRGKISEDKVSPKVQELRDLRKKYNHLKHQIDQLMARQAGSGNTVLTHLMRESQQLTDDISRLRVQLEQLTTTDKGKLQRLNPNQNIHLCQQELDKAERRLQEATHTVLLSAKSKRLKEYLAAIREEALARLKARIISGTNTKIAKIIKTERVEVAAIDPYLILKNKGGGSEGQSLAIAYSYLGSMFEGSTYRLPFVVDSPAGSLDLDVRRAVAPILPALFEQLVIFITSGEREGFADHYYTLGNKVQFLTISKEPDKAAICTPGVEAFRTFQGEED